MATGVPIETLVTKAEEYATAMAQSEWAKWLHTWLKGEGWRETPRRAKPKVDRPVAKKKPAPEGRPLWIACQGPGDQGGLRLMARQPSRGWEYYPNLQRRPHAPNKGRGRLQRQIARAFHSRARGHDEHDLRLVHVVARRQARQPSTALVGAPGAAASGRSDRPRADHRPPVDMAPEARGGGQVCHG